MDKDYFLLKDRIKQIESSFIKDGWVTIYEADKGNNIDQCLIFCSIVHPEKMKTYKNDTDWIIQPGSEGKPCVIGTRRNGKWINSYQTHSDEGIEPFIYSRWFTHKQERYIDISEEFVLYFKLYEHGESKQTRKYYFIDDLGDEEEVIVVDAFKVKVKLRFLIEYISIRKVYFAICFDFMRLDKLDQEGFKVLDENFQSEKYFYNHYMRHLGLELDESPLQSWIHGKAFIYFDKTKTDTYHFDYDSRPFEKFITGYDNNGNEVLEECKKEDHKLFKLTYFKKEVLNKYYNDPSKYEVDGWHVKSPFFFLKMDNHHEIYVAVFLTELSSIPYKEQLHWKHYNIQPQKGISAAYHQTMILGNWAEHSGTPDLYFKEKYKTFNERWKEKYGWEFYKPLSKEDSYNFVSLHIPASNNIKVFCEQVLSIVKITIDSLNEEELGKKIELEPNDKGITKLEKYLKNEGVELPDMIEFLRNLQDLRSGLIAHRFSTSNKKANKVFTYFKLSDNEFIATATEIFIKSIYTINTLEKIFLT